eukprot:scaffold63340_cov22-Tisochrysis_lutea.AAC.1
MRACVSEGWARVLGRRQPPHYVHVSCVKAGMAEAGVCLVFCMPVGLANLCFHTPYLALTH